MKKKVLAVLAAAALVLAASAAWATPTVNLYDQFGAAPLVETSGFTSGSPAYDTALEYAYVTGPMSFMGPVGTYGIKIFDSAVDPVIGFAVLNSRPMSFPNFNLTFVSSGATNFEVFAQIFSNFSDALVEFDRQLPTAATIVADGSLQTLFNLSPFLQVNAQFDPVPIPTSAILFGTGLLGLVPAWKLRRSRA